VKQILNRIKRSHTTGLPIEVLCRSSIAQTQRCRSLRTGRTKCSLIRPKKVSLQLSLSAPLQLIPKKCRFLLSVAVPLPPLVRPETNVGKTKESEKSNPSKEPVKVQAPHSHPPHLTNMIIQDLDDSHSFSSSLIHLRLHLPLLGSNSDSKCERPNGFHPRFVLQFLY